MMDFKHGGDIWQFAKDNGFNIDEVVDLSSNINFIKPKINIDFNKLNISSYPNYNILKEVIAKNYSIDINQFELFNGATSAIYSLFRELNLNSVTLYVPIYLEYKRCAILNGYRINYIDRFKNINQDIEKNSLVVFVNPSTPDGEFYNIKPLLKLWIEKEATILIDESFLEFTPFKSAIKYIREYKKLYILKSMTKFYSSAGIRVGIIISNQNNIKRLKEKEPIWKISEFDSEYIQSALRDSSFKKKALSENIKNRDRVIEILKRVKYIDKIYKSDANFILIKLKDINSKEFQQILTPYKILVRNCSNFDFLDSSFIRIAIKDSKSIDILEEALCMNFI